MSSPERPPRKGPDISAAQVAGGALAAVSAAVVASFLGVGGTVAGAALGSIVASVGGAVYSHSFRQAGQKLGETRVVTVVTTRRAGEPDPGPGAIPVIEAEHGEDPAYAESAAAQEAPDTLAGSPTASPAPTQPAGAPRWLSWKAALALTVVAFVVAIAAIEVVELVIGRPISGGSGGTTISHLVKPKDEPSRPAPTPSPTPTSTATRPPVSTESPTTTPTGTPTGSPTTGPTDTPTSTPTGTPTSTPTG